ncbi:hypothetical protein EMCG_06055 [[Emmonsia] crescens]|uniref:Uncharacterized protein n=1 Tax=[Emmonsia] crescens TaxID=73230 RepID=A0A0G2IC78_9EURO|nr:hypothetical protein EMCG_06055 [Emmonsia crescens UAMH 3008]
MYKRRSVDQLYKLNQVNKYHDVKTNLNQTSTVLTTHLSQAIKIDENLDTEVESALYDKLKKKLK